MKQILSIFLLSMMAFVASAQSVQLIEVLRYNGEKAKTPLEGVSVSAANAGSVMTNAQGEVTLQFRTLKVGDQIQFRRIDLAGYEVMNTEVVESMIIGEGKHTIVLCDSEELAKVRDGYRTAAARHYEKQLADAQSKLEALQQEGKMRDEEFARRMDELEEQYEQQLQTLDTYVDKFARIDLSELDTFEQEIMALVQEGRFEEAIARYEDQHLTERLQQGVRQQQQLQNDQQVLDRAIEAKDQEAERLEQNIDKQIDLLRRVGGEENLQKVEELEEVKKKK